MELEGKVAVVTGAGMGIGKAIAVAMAAEGASVVVNDIVEETAREVAAQIAARKGRAVPVIADVGTMDGAQRTIHSAVANFGKLDILVNNAGKTDTGYVWEISEEVWDESIRVNLKSAFACTKFAAPIMIAQKSGRIINISSNAGRLGMSKSPGYSTAKAGMIGFTKSCARELAPFNVLVNAVTPIADTPMYRAKPGEFQKWLVDSIPMGRLGRLEEIAAMVVFVASDKASFSTGQVFDAAGGRFM